jgi:carboxyl-terminal processing protease
MRNWLWIWLLFLIAFFGLVIILFVQLSDEIEIMTQVWSLSKSPKPDSAFFFGVGKLIQSEYYYTSPAPMESLPIIWQRTKLKIQNNPEKNDSLIFVGLTEFCELFPDNHTYFLNPNQIRTFLQRNQFTGIGIQLVETDSNQKQIKSLRILKIFPNSPAEKAGLKIGDFILAIDQKSIRKFKSINEIIETIRGEAGTKVNLKIWRKGWKEPRIFSINRDKIFIHPVNWQMIDKKIAYLELKEFNSLAVEEFDQAVSEIVKNKSEAIILDLRDNPGGALKSVEKILSHWICGVSYKLETRNGWQTYRSGNILLKPKLKKIKTIVLINQNTASASELLIGALKDYGLVTLIGQRTYGKGCGQRLIFLPFRTALGVTNFLWFSPSGHNIDRKGFKPDIEIKFDLNLWLDFEIDNQLQEAIKFIKEEK